MPQTTSMVAEAYMSGRAGPPPARTLTGASSTTGRALGKHSVAPEQVTPIIPLCPLQRRGNQAHEGRSHTGSQIASPCLSFPIFKNKGMASVNSPPFSEFTVLAGVGGRDSPKGVDGAGVIVSAQAGAGNEGLELKGRETIAVL